LVFIIWREGINKTITRRVRDEYYDCCGGFGKGRISAGGGRQPVARNPDGKVESQPVCCVVRDHTKNGTPRGVPLNRDAIAVLDVEQGKHPNYCFTYRGARIAGAVGNSAWYEAVKRAKLDNFRFHDLRHTWASWHRQSGTSTDELKDLGGWKSRVMVDRYAKFATEHLAVAAARIESGLLGQNVGNVLRFPYGGERVTG